MITFESLDVRSLCLHIMRVSLYVKVIRLRSDHKKVRKSLFPQSPIPRLRFMIHDYVRVINFLLLLLLLIIIM